MYSRPEVERRQGFEPSELHSLEQLTVYFSNFGRTIRQDFQVRTFHYHTIFTRFT